MTPPSRHSREVVGLIPAAGAGTRVAPLPCSKEIFPVGFRQVDDERVPRPKVACENVLDAMRCAAVEKVYMVVREGKWDIPAYLGDGHRLGLSIAYLMMRLPFGVPFTLDQAYAFVCGRVVVCGFPDILTEPEDVFTPLLNRLEATGAAVALGLFPVDDPELMDMVDVDEDGRVRFIQVKPGPLRFPHGWAVAAWSGDFTELLHDYVARATERIRDEGGLAREPHLGDAIQAAIEAGLLVQSVAFPHGSFIDVGSPANLVNAWTFGAPGRSPQAPALHPDARPR